MYATLLRLDVQVLSLKASYRNVKVTVSTKHNVDTIDIDQINTQSKADHSEYTLVVGTLLSCLDSKHTKPNSPFLLCAILDN